MAYPTSLCCRRCATLWRVSNAEDGPPDIRWRVNFFRNGYFLAGVSLYCAMDAAGNVYHGGFHDIAIKQPPADQPEMMALKKYDPDGRFVWGYHPYPHGVISAGSRVDQVLTGIRCAPSGRVVVTFNPVANPFVTAIRCLSAAGDVVFSTDDLGAYITGLSDFQDRAHDFSAFFVGDFPLSGTFRLLQMTENYVLFLNSQGYAIVLDPNDWSFKFIIFDATTIGFQQTSQYHIIGRQPYGPFYFDGEYDDMTLLGCVIEPGGVSDRLLVKFRHDHDSAGVWPRVSLLLIDMTVTPTPAATPVPGRPAGVFYALDWRSVPPNSFGISTNFLEQAIICDETTILLAGDTTDAAADLATGVDLGIVSKPDTFYRQQWLANGLIGIGLASAGGVIRNWDRDDMEIASGRKWMFPGSGGLGPVFRPTDTVALPDGESVWAGWYACSVTLGDE
jgi:hypothetical protein